MGILVTVLLGATAVAPLESREEATALLRTTKASVHFKDATVSEVARFVAQLTGLNIVVGPSVQKDRDVRLKATDLPVRSLLRLVLGPRNLVAAWRDGAIMILARDRLRTAFSVRLYDVGALLEAVPDFPGPNIELASQLRGAGGPLSGCACLFIEPQSPINEDFLADLVMSYGGEQVWNHSEAWIVLRGRSLIVSQTASVHHRIRVLLGKLNHFRGRKQ